MNNMYTTFPIILFYYAFIFYVYILFFKKNIFPTYTQLNNKLRLKLEYPFFFLSLTIKFHTPKIELIFSFGNQN